MPVCHTPRGPIPPPHPTHIPSTPTRLHHLSNRQVRLMRALSDAGTRARGRMRRGSAYVRGGPAPRLVPSPRTVPPHALSSRLGPRKRCRWHK